MLEEQVMQTVEEHAALEPAGQLSEEFLENGHLAGCALKAYGTQMQHQNEDERIVQFLPLVHRIVSKIAGYLQPPMSREDLVSAGTIGLIKAARDFDPTKDAEFKTYAYIRIRGAVLDELRSWSFAPPNVKKLIDRAQAISEAILNERGSLPGDDEIAERMGIDADKMYQVFEVARARHFLSMHGMDDDSPALGQFLAADTQNAHAGLEEAERKTHLAKAISTLPEKQRQIILLYYHRELTMKQVAEVLEITESRVSQLHAAAVFKLSTQMKQWNDAQQ